MQLLQEKQEKRKIKYLFNSLDRSFYIIDNMYFLFKAFSAEKSLQS